MQNIREDVNFLYSKYTYNIEQVSNLFEIKKIKLKDIKVSNLIKRKNELDIGIFDIGGEVLFTPLVVEYQNKYFMLDDFNQFKSYNLELTIEVMVIPNFVFRIDNKGIHIKQTNSLYFEDRILYISDFYSKFFICYPYKELINKKYRLYEIHISDYINLLEAIANIVQLINQKIYFLKIRGEI